MKFIILHALVFMLLLLGACGGATDPVDQTQHEAAVREAIKQIWEQCIDGMEKGDVAALVSLYAEDTINMPFFDSTQNGLSQVETMWTEALSSSTVDVRSQTTAEVFVHGGMAYEFGTFEFEQKSTTSDDESVIQKFRYVSVFQQQSDGSWKFYRWLAQSPTAG